MLISVMQSDYQLKDSDITSIEVNYRDANGHWQQVEKGEVNPSNTEIYLKVNFAEIKTEDLLLNLNYTHLSAKDSEEKELARRPKNQIGFGADYYGIDKFHFNVNGYYIGDRYDESNKSGAETGNYTLWNTVVDYDINKTFSTYLKVDNLFDKYYQTIDGYATAERSAYLGLKANF